MMRACLSHEVIAAVHDLAREHGVANVRVFGSVARGDATPTSDIDLLVDFAAERGGFAFVHFCDAIAALLQRRVDVVTERSLPVVLRQTILEQAIPLEQMSG